jgi:mannose-6-phosphate isomerase-like protein (cupin superfamily)
VIAVKAWEEKGVSVGAPYRRDIKVILAPDKHGVKELTFVQAILHPGSQTDYHIHDRPELITIVTGRGVAVCEGKETPIEPDMVLWMPAGEKHQIKNTGPETMKLANVFIPAITEAETVGPRLQAAADAAKR